MNASRVADQPMNAILVHLSHNMWGEPDSQEKDSTRARPELWFDYSFWTELTQRFVDAGFNMVVLDLGDGVRYESHPEIAVKNAWSVQKLRDEAQRLREMGLELIPKLNFSSAHDTWLGPYARCVSTPTYYQVCRDLIEESCRILDTPRFLHLGMDEETAGHQQKRTYVVVRQFDLWWHDTLFLCEEVQRHGVRPWLWSDYIWHHTDEYLQRMPKSVLQSNWYYSDKFDFEPGDTDLKAKYVDCYRQLDAHGYDQVPTFSNWEKKVNTAKTIAFGRANLHPDRLKGFIQTYWHATVPEYRDQIIEAIDLFAEAI